MFLLVALACNLTANQVYKISTWPGSEASTDVSTPAPIPTDTATILHAVTPAGSPRSGGLVYDVDSSVTAPENRAPYGDAYNINRLERPFQADMSYVPDLDILTYNVSDDGIWIYVSIQLVGTDPNNPLGIAYGVVIDEDADGFGDHLVWAKPPYTPVWEAANVQVFADNNHDTGGYSQRSASLHSMEMDMKRSFLMEAWGRIRTWPGCESMQVYLLPFRLPSKSP